MTGKDFTARCDYLQKDPPELHALLAKEFHMSLIMGTLSELICRCNNFVDKQYFVANDGEKRFFGNIADYAINQQYILELLKQNLSLQIQAAMEIYHVDATNSTKMSE